PVKFGTIDLALIMMTVIWGMNAVIVKLTYTQIPPMAFMAVRFVIAGALLLIILRVTEGSLRVDRRDWPKFLVA
ncbi:MAG: EamA family transporter, partial [Caldilinea sp.]|nr:EamA family transporter [Caldilinea sp.]